VDEEAARCTVDGSFRRPSELDSVDMVRANRLDDDGRGQQVNEL
jgi:hypothetical protein